MKPRLRTDLLGILTVLVCLSVQSRAGDLVPLPNSQPLTWQDDLSARMLAGLHRFVERKIDQSIQTRPRYWKRDYSSREAYEKSVEPNRERFRKYIGLVDPRVPAAMERWGDDDNPAIVAETERYRVFQVRWPVLEGVSGEGLLIEPKTPPVGFVVALPDADQTPEMIAGLASGVEPESQFARQLAENGFEVVVPALINRSDEFSGNPEIYMTPQPHREWIYRQAFHMGRHVIGYEVQKVLAAVDWFERRAFRIHSPIGNQKSKIENQKIGVAGYGEGGLIAFYSAAVDTRIDACLVSGYFKSRQQVATEPIYRNVWALLHEFGDEEIATLIAPRELVVEYSEEPKVDGSPAPRPGRRGGSAGGKLSAPPYDEVAEEVRRMDSLLQLDFHCIRLVGGEDRRPLKFGSCQALQRFSERLGVATFLPASQNRPRDRRTDFDPNTRQKRQVKELENHAQRLVQTADRARDDFFLYAAMPGFKDKKWNMILRHPTLSSEAFREAGKKLPSGILGGSSRTGERSAPAAQPARSEDLRSREVDGL